MEVSKADNRTNRLTGEPTKFLLVSGQKKQSKKTKIILSVKYNGPIKWLRAFKIAVDEEQSEGSGSSEFQGVAF